MQQECLIFRDLSLGYNGQVAVEQLSGTVRTGSLTAVVGANGSGKSTLMKGIAGILAPMGGSFMRDSRSRLAYLPQKSELDTSFPARVIDLVSLGLWPRRGLLGRHRAEDHQAITDALRAVGLEDFEKRPLDSLSGGQLQRTLFARVLVQDADLILLDEPFNAIDSTTVSFHDHGDHADIDVDEPKLLDVEISGQSPATLSSARAMLHNGLMAKTRRASLRNNPFLKTSSMRNP